MNLIHFDDLLVALRERRANGESWEAIAESYASPHITRGHIYKIAVKEWNPNKLEIRHALGLVAYESVPVCPHCGTVHRRKTCPDHPGRKRARVAVNTRDMRSAAQTLRAHLTQADLAELTDLLMAGQI